MSAASRNAERLAKDARVLFDNRRHASCAALAILSLEESGKSRILRELALARDEKDLRECWREYRTHTKKNLLWPILERFIKGARRAGDFVPLLEPDAEHPYILDKLKQISIYTDCFQKGRWSLPEEIVEEQLAESLLMAAEVLSQHHEVTKEEIDLWIQYVQPYWKTSNEACQRALFEWDKEMRKRGLLRGKTTMEKFFMTGIDPTDP